MRLRSDWEAADDWDDTFDEASIEAMAEALHDRYVDALPEELELAMDHMFESLSEPEAFNLASAIHKAGSTVAQVGANPTAARLASIAAPVAGGTLGMAIGGPVGAHLGSSAAKALHGAATPGRRAVAAPAAGSAAPLAGSTAAAQALVLTQCPQVLQALLALSLGQHGQRAVAGVPVTSLMKTLSSMFSQAASDGEELDYWEGDDAAAAGEWSESVDMPYDERPHRMYAHLIGGSSWDAR